MEMISRRPKRALLKGPPKSGRRLCLELGKSFPEIDSEYIISDEADLMILESWQQWELRNIWIYFVSKWCIYGILIFVFYFFCLLCNQLKLCNL